MMGKGFFNPKYILYPVVTLVLQVRSDTETKALDRTYTRISGGRYARTEEKYEMTAICKH